LTAVYHRTGKVKPPTPARALLITTLVGMLFLAACGSEPAVDGDASARQQRITPGIEGLEQQANQLLDGGPKAFKARLAGLDGHPVVVNQWASWCGPCRFEFPFFERQAKRLRGRVAFLGVNTQDSRGNAAAFLKEHPVPYPHYFDPDGSVARVFRGGRAFPTTAFYDASGDLSYTHIGGYASEAKLQEEIERYAADG